MSIAAKTILVEFKSTTWAPRAIDKDASDLVIRHYNVTNKKVGGFWKKILESPELSIVNSVCNSAKKFHETLTLPWLSSGFKMDIMLVINQGKYATEMQGYKMQYETAVRNFIAAYPAQIQKEEARLGDLWKRNDYPDVNDIASKFEFHYKFYPLPNPSTCDDFRSQLTDSEYQNLKEDIEAEFNNTKKETMRGLWQKVYDSVSDIQVRMADEDKVFRKSIFDNLQQLCDILPDLNIDDDKTLEGMAADIEHRLLSTDPKQIRTDKQVRSNISDEASDILTTINSYIN